MVGAAADSGQRGSATIMRRPQSEVRFDSASAKRAQVEAVYLNVGCEGQGVQKVPSLAPPSPSLASGSLDIWGIDLAHSWHYSLSKRRLVALSLANESHDCRDFSGSG
jgi:hypothetical protein